MRLMNQTVKALVYRLSNHLTSRYQLSIEFVKNVFEVVTLDTLFRVEKFEELLHELGCHVHFEGTNLN